MALALILAGCIAPTSARAEGPALTYEVGRILIERAGPLDPLPSEPCSSEASTPDGAGMCATAPGCIVFPDPLMNVVVPDDPPCRLSITFELSGLVEGASGPVTLEMMGEISSASGLVLGENVNLLYGGPFEVDVRPDGSFTTTVGPIEWRSWGAGPTCSHVALYWVKVHNPDEPLGMPPDDPGPGADANRCV